MIELRSKCHGAQLEVRKGNIPGLESYYACVECGCMCEISIVNPDFDVEEKGRELFGWSADPHTISECVSWIEALIRELNIDLKGG